MAVLGQDVKWSRDTSTKDFADWWMSHQKRSESTLTVEDAVTCWEPWVPDGPENVLNDLQVNFIKKKNLKCSLTEKKED